MDCRGGVLPLWSRVDLEGECLLGGLRDELLSDLGDGERLDLRAGGDRDGEREERLVGEREFLRAELM